MSTGLIVKLDDVDVSCHAFAPLSVKWGRDHPGDSYEPRRAALTFDDVARPRRGQTLVATLADPTASPTWQHATGTWAAAVGSWDAQRVNIVLFRGRITDTSSSWDTIQVNGEKEPRWGAVVDVVAMDPMSELAGQNVGDVPWPQESVSARAARIQALTPLAWTTDPSATLVAARDVDSQPAYDLLDDLAHMASLSGGLWYDPNTQTARFLLDAQRNSMAPTITVDACSIGADASAIVDASDVVNDVNVTYKNPADPNAEPSAHVVQDASVATYGRRGRTISTELTSAAAAQQRAQTEATRFGAAVERWQDVSLGTKYGPVSTALAKSLLSVGPAVRVRMTTLPAPALPTWDGYVEGWDLTVDSESWDVALSLSPASWSGPLITWADVSPSQRWADVIRPWTWADALASLPSTITQAGFDSWTAPTAGDAVNYPDGRPIGWVLFWISGPRGTIRKGTPWDGTSSLKWIAAGTQASAQRLISTAWPVKAGATVDVSVMAERLGAGAASLELGVYTSPGSSPYPFVAGTVYLTALAPTPLTGGWVRYSGSIVVPAGHKYASVSLVTSAAAGVAAQTQLDSVTGN